MKKGINKSEGLADALSAGTALCLQYCLPQSLWISYELFSIYTISGHEVYNTA